MFDNSSKSDYNINNKFLFIPESILKVKIDFET